MDFEALWSTMSDDEKEKFKSQRFYSYYAYLTNKEDMKSALDKLDKKVILTSEERECIFNNLFLISCKAMQSDESISFLDRILLLLCKFGVHVLKDDTPLFNECYRMIEAITSIKKERELQEDLLEGVKKVKGSVDDSNFDILFKQYYEAIIFFDNRDAFLEVDSSYGKISSEERMFINSFNRAYGREKELLKEYK